MPEFPSSSIIPETIGKPALQKRLHAFGVNSDGEKKLLQVRLTLAELGLWQTDQETEDLLTQWFYYQKPELKAVCQGRGVANDSTIAQMRRALVWDMVGRGLLHRKTANQNAHSEDSGEEAPSQMVLKMPAKNVIKKVILLDVEDSTRDEPLPRAKPPKPLKKPTKMATRKVILADSEDSTEEKPLVRAKPPELLRKPTDKVIQKGIILDAKDSTEEEPFPIAKPPKPLKKPAKIVPRKVTIDESEDATREEASTKSKSGRKLSPKMPKVWTKAKTDSREISLSAIQKELDVLVKKK